MKASLEFKGGVSFDINVGSGHSIRIDGSPDIGGENLGARPMELLLAGLGGCTAMDVLQIMRKSRQDIEDVRIDIDAERAADPPRVFTALHVHFVMTGNNLKESVVERAINLSAEKYCSASIMLAKTATITHSFEIVESGSRAANS